MATNPTSQDSGSDQSQTAEEATLSIGALSKATGIPKETIRTWERRYGFPAPARNSAGHRRYRLSTVDRLRLVASAVESGHRPANVVGEDPDTLRAMLQRTGALDDSPDRRAFEESKTDAPRPPNDAPRWLNDWMSAAFRLDGEGLDLHFRRAWNELGGVQFLTRRARVFLRALGDAWIDGTLQIHHEHFTSERLRDFLTSKWRPLSDRASGPKVVCATLPGEHHILGLHMAAVIMSMAGCQPLFLGADTPIADIAGAARQESCQAVLISVSAAADRAMSQRALASLRLALHPNVELVIGGSGNPTHGPNFTCFDDLDDLYTWARNFVDDAS